MRYCLLIIRILILIFSVFDLSYNDVYDKIIKDYKKQIEEKNKNLRELKIEIDKKKYEQKEYEKQEKQIRQELNKVEQKLNNIKKDIEESLSKIKKTENKLIELEHNLKLIKTEIDTNRQKLYTELDRLYRINYSYQNIFIDPYDEPLRICSIKDREQKISFGKTQKILTEQDQVKYNKLKNELIQLKEQLNKQEIEQKNIIEEKRKILKNICDMKYATEKEIKALNKTSKELQVFLQELEDKKNKTIELKRQQELAKLEFCKKKGYLPWPVQGKVLTNFGKIKHPELDTVIICNGIKIASTPGSTVYSIDQGEVVYADEFRSYGKTVIISHQGGVYTVYGLLSEIIVKKDMDIKSMDPIGLTSKEDGILYFEIRVNGIAEDPLLWLKKQ